MIISAIAAMSENGVIGRANQLPWDVPEDMKFFRETTRGAVVIMGRKTFESMGMALPKRKNIVITRSPDFSASDVEVAPSVGVAIERAKGALAHSADDLTQTQEVFIIGGGEIYKESLPFLDRVYLTVIHKDLEGDAYFPYQEVQKAFTQIKSSSRTRSSGPGQEEFTIFTYERA